MSEALSVISEEYGVAKAVSHQTVSDWVKTAGLAMYKEARKAIRDSKMVTQRSTGASERWARIPKRSFPKPDIHRKRSLTSENAARSVDKRTTDGYNTRQKRTSVSVMRQMSFLC